MRTRIWPRIGPLATFGIFYLTGILLHFVCSWRIARRYGLKRRVWITVSTCYLLGMTVGANLLFDLRHGTPDVLRGDTEGHLYSGLLSLTQLLCLAATIVAAAILDAVIWRHRDLPL